jgi:hypothetical protein
MQLIRQRKFQTGQAYFDEKFKALNQIDNISEVQTVMYIKDGLDDKDYITSTVAVSDLTILESVIKQLDTRYCKAQEETAQMNYAQFGFQGRGRGKNRFQQQNRQNHQNQQGQQRPPPTCYRCHRPGHVQANCRTKPENFLTVQIEDQQQMNVMSASNTMPISANTQTNKTSSVNGCNFVRENKPTFLYSQTSYETICTLNYNSMPKSLVHLEGNQKLISAGWDSGATISAINGTSFDKLSASIQARLDTTNLPHIKLANGSFTRPRGSLILDIDFFINSQKSYKTKIKAFVVDGLPLEFIIGMNVIQNVKLDFPNNQVQFSDNTKIPLIGSYCMYKDQLISPSISVAKKTLLKPGVLSMLPIKVNGNGTFLVEDNENLSTLVVEGRHVDKATKWIYVVNKQPYTFELKEGEKIDCKIVSEEDLFFVDIANVKPVEEEIEEQCDINPEAPKEAKEKLINILRKVKEMLKEKTWGTNRIKHRIELTKEYANRCNAYVYGPKENEFMKEQIDFKLKNGIIRPSKEQNVSPVVVAHHPRTGKLRMCVDYRKLNECTKKENHLMPRVWQTLQKLAGSDWFSSIDLFKGFWQVPIEEQDIHLTAFICNEGIFEYLFMPFGLTNSSFTFQRLMDEVLDELKNNCAEPYIDDVCAHTNGSAMKHVENLEIIMVRLVEAGLRPNFEKCRFLYSEMDFFGHLVSKNGIKVNPNRLEKLLGIKELKDVSDVRMFLGLCVVYFRFIKNFAKIAEPLINLTRTGVPFKMGDKEKLAMENLKDELLKDTFLAIPDYNYPFHIKVDASDYAIGYHLYQEIEGRTRIISFGGKTLSKSQKDKWFPGHKELYAIYMALQEFRWCIYGKKCTVYTDHKAWSFIRSIQKRPPKTIASWLIEIMDFDDIEIEWIPGKLNTVSDAISRLWGKEGIINMCLALIDATSFPEEEKLKIVKKIHTDPIRGGHFAFDKTLAEVKDRFFWKDMARYVKEVCSNCEECKTNKHSKIKAPLTPIIAEAPWNIVGMDIIGPYPQSSQHEYRWILIVIDYFSKWVELIALKSTEAKYIVDKLKRKALARYQNPKLIISDGAKQFVESKEFLEMLHKYHIAHDFSATKHQQANGQTERFVGTLKPILRIKCQNNVDKWPKKLEFVQASINTAKSSATKHSAYHVLYGYEPRMTVESEYENWDKEVISRHEEIRKNILRSKESDEAYYNNPLAKTQTHQPGDSVLVKEFNRKNDLEPLFKKGEVVSERGPNSYIVKSASGTNNVNSKDIISTKKDENFKFDNDLVGKRVKVWWKDDQRYREGTVIKQNSNLRFGSHVIKYDDPEKDEVHEYLTAAPRGKDYLIEKFIVKRNTTQNSQEKVQDSNLDSEDEDYKPNLDSSYSSSDDSEFSDADTEDEKSL